MANNVYEPYLGFKDAVLLVPLLGSGLALSYDAGFFSSFDAQYFYLFTLTEHLSFAALALPIASTFSVIGITLRG